MGLDMYLFRKEKSGSRFEEIGYWRKANAIHNWFVKNAQGGVDECQFTELTREQLTELLTVCKRVMEEARVVDGQIERGVSYQGGVATPIMEEGFVITNPEICEELLPSASGFFFGSTDYNEYYLEDVKDTVEILEKALLFTDSDYAYQSSW